MDYNYEYIKKNPNMHLEHSDMKFDQLLRVLPDKRYDSILDIACGAGAITLKFQEYFKPNYIEGIDISEAMISKAKELDTKRLINWKIADIYSYQRAKNFDLIVCADIIEHLEQDAKFVQILSKLGQEVVIKVPLEDSYFNRFLRKFKIYDSWKDTEIRYGHIKHYSENALDKVFIENGFTIKKKISVPMPKRSKLIWEAIRLAFIPISLISTNIMVKFAGGFKIYHLESKNI